ncbi:MAG: sn-glycerol-3-phosphate ABC transporter ATP-binding protein UgpC [Candidatus Aureabacteria bacterium]|nr:sn-glycerol-3-phosphate ABC transporter ATP-binding protein UgpC [Candidatus Auribacterota bacterium]
MAKVSLNNISKTYDEKEYAVLNCNLEIEDREFVVLVGPSGCGKSTTLRMVAGLESVSSGEIMIGDMVVNHIPPKDRDIAMVFQNYALYPHMTVFDNMAFGLKLRRFSKNEISERVLHAAKILNIEPFLHRKPRELSGGERQRVAVGRAIVRKPQVFLFDEPLSNLDAKMRVQMRTEISRLHKRLQTTMIYVTHDQVEAMTMGDRIVVMNKGEIQQVADPLTIYEHPRNLFVAGFIGSPPMNFFSGKIISAGSILQFVIKGMSLQLTHEMNKKMHSYINQEVIMGIRPEKIYDKLFAKTATDTNTITASVEVVEQMGSEMFTYLKNESADFVARLDAHEQLEPGQDMELVFDMSKCHFFEPGTGINLVD